MIGTNAKIQAHTSEGSSCDADDLATLVVDAVLLPEEPLFINDLF